MAMVINENPAANATRSLENYVKLAQNAQTGGFELPKGGGSNASGPGTGYEGGNGGASSSTFGGAASSPTSARSAAVPTDVGKPPAPAQTTALLTAGGAYFAVPTTMLVVLGAGFMLL